jgi:hypothetical protein
MGEIMKVKMRSDLAKEGIEIPGGISYQNYDDLMYIEYFSAKDLEGAEEYDTGEDPDSHAFCPVMLKDGRWFYFIGVDLEWTNEEVV